MTLIILFNQIKISVGKRCTFSFLPLAALKLLLTAQVLVLFLFSLTLCLAVFCFVVQAGLELSIPCLGLLSAGIMGLSHHTWQDSC